MSNRTSILTTWLLLATFWAVDAQEPLPVAPSPPDTDSPFTDEQLPAVPSPTTDVEAVPVEETPPFVHGHSAPPRRCPCVSPTCRNCRHEPFAARLQQRKAEYRAKMQDKYWGYPEFFHERPFGSYLNSTLQTQINKGLEKQLTLYDFDFAGDALTPRGHYQTRKIADKLQCIAGTVTIESTENVEQDQRRREAVVEALNQLGVPIVAEHVNVKWMLRPGLTGLEARDMYDNLLQQTKSRGGGLSPAGDFTPGGAGGTGGTQ